MVLLNSSTISVVVSSSVVCLFTFLLFLSGYVLQQQTVRSLQEALQAPIEVRVRVPPTLPPQFQNVQDQDDAVVGADEANETVDQRLASRDGTEGPGNDQVQIVLGDAQDITRPRPSSSPSSPPPPLPQSPQSKPSILLQTVTNLDIRLAYVLPLPELSHLCSALHFAKSYRQTSLILSSIIYLYPSFWETSSSSAHTDALRLLLQSEHQYGVLLHPVPISRVWSGIDVETQLLAEVARGAWNYDRVMYLRMPGLLVDAEVLDSALVETYKDRRILKARWTRLKAPGKRSGGLKPDVLMWAQGQGLVVPVGEVAEGLTARIEGSEEGRDKSNVGYVLFDDDESRTRRGQQMSRDRKGVWEVFERGREEACQGTELLS